MKGENTNIGYDDYVAYIDTDSVVGDSLIYINDKKLTIEEYFNEKTEYEYKDDFNEQYVKKCKNDYSLSFNTKTSKIEKKEVTYVMKHKIEKELFEIEIDDKKVIVTEDQSLVVKRKGEYIRVSPKYLQKNDILMNI